MASRKIQAIFGNTVNRDHQYWPCPDRAAFNNVAADETYPFNVDPDWNWTIGLTLPQIMALMWRVNNWNISGTWGANVSGEHSGDHVVHTADFVTTINGSTSFVQWLNVGSPIQLMHYPLPLGLRHDPPDYAQYAGDTGFTVCNGGLHTTTCNVSTVITDDSPDIATSPETRTDRGQIDVAISEYDVRGRDCVVYDGTFNPCVVVLGVMQWAHMNAFVSFQDIVGDGFETAGTLTISPGICPDIVLPLVVHAQYIISVVPGTEVFNSAFANIMMTPYDFFPYKNGLGQEVYNTSTGELNDLPFPQVGKVNPLA